MRISDWSSDVCSSDLDVLRHHSPALAQRADRAERDEIAGRDDAVDVLPARQELGGRAFGRFEDEVDADIERGIESQDRKSVVSGKSWSVRVDIGGRPYIQKKKDKYKVKYNLET